MAVYNEILAGRFNRALQKLFGIKGPPPTPQLSSEIIPVMPLFFGPEGRYLEGWNRFAVNMVVAAAAANQSGVRLRNPANSTVVAVIEKISWLNNNNANQTLRQQFGATNADLAVNIGGAVRLDARAGSASVGSIIQITQQNTAVTIPVLTTLVELGQNANLSTDIILTDDQEITVLPGDAIQWLVVTVNTNLDISFQWRERVLEEGERS